MRTGISASALRGAYTRHATAWLYLAAVCAAEITYALLPGHDRAALLAWSSTSVHNLEHHPVGCLVASAFFPTTFLLAWPVVIAVAMFAATSVLGAWRTALTCAAGHVVGTIVSEGIVAYRVAHGSLPAADRFLIDVGPSYVVLAAIATALLYGRWLARAAAAADLLLLIFIGQIFAGLSRLDVAAVGHLTALATGAAAATLFVWHQRRKARVLNRLRFRILPTSNPVITAKLSIGSVAFPGHGERRTAVEGNCRTLSYRDFTQLRTTAEWALNGL
jgi:hypothetical protein